MISKVANTDVGVLITGDSGTGKELIAHQIHSQSTKNSQSLVKVNCAAIPSELIESDFLAMLKAHLHRKIKDRARRI